MSEIEKLKEEHKAAIDTCTSIGAIVGKSDTMSLSEQVAAIVSENVALKSFISRSCYVFDDENIENYSDYYTPADESPLMPKITATDAVIADIEARGVEKFAVEMHADISGDDAREFAQQLRSGKGAAS